MTIISSLLWSDCVLLLSIHRSLITTLHQPPSQPLSWDSQWRLLRLTTTPRSPLEPPRSPACRFVCDKETLNSQQQQTRSAKTCQRLVCVSLFCSAPPAAASREGGAEGNPSWTHGPQIHLWQPGAALPARCRRPCKSRCLSEAPSRLFSSYQNVSRFFLKSWMKY